MVREVGGRGRGGGGVTDDVVAGGVEVKVGLDEPEVVGDETGVPGWVEDGGEGRVAESELG